MIVNPQFFNYRLTIGVLIIVISAISVFSYINYNSVKSDRDYIESENKLLQNEIREIISSYDKLEGNNDTLTSKLDNTIALVEVTSDSIKKLKTNLRLVSNNRKDTKQLEQNNRDKRIQKDSLIDGTVALNKISKSIDNTTVIKKSFEPELSIVRSSFKVKAYQSKSSRLFRTDKASKTQRIQVCATMPKDIIDYKGSEALYIQIIGPDNNVVADKGVVKFGESSLIYSLKTNAVESYKNLKVCEDILNEKKLVKGNYYVNIFGDKKKLASTKLKLY